MAMFVVFLPAPPGSGEEEVRNSFIPQLAVSTGSRKCPEIQSVHPVRM